jgi:threonine dehydratase
MTRYEPVESLDETTIFPYHDLTPPSTADVYRARKTVARHLPRTPLVRSETLSAELDANVYLKREDTLPTGAFKVRGGVTLMDGLDPEFHERGVIAASTGNHGQSIAYAGREFGVPVTIAVPENANPDKVAAMERFGARIEFQGADFDESREWAERQATEAGSRYVHSANEPKLVAGVGTAGLDIAEELPEIDVLFCPVGGGSSAAGYCLTVGALADAEVVGVQSEAAPAVYLAWHEGHLDPVGKMETFAEGIATRVPFALTTRMLRERLDDFVLVSERELRESMATLATHEHIIAEGAAAAGLAGMRRRADELAGKAVALPISGRNIPFERLASLVGKDNP